tara:strand:+ start:2101 stop:3351 length:1251 start_codon:yes stop_codon:yes gene_type:complete
MSSRRVVVTGLGALTPIGNNLSEFWESLISGKSGANPITYFDTSEFKTNFACELKNYDALNYFDRKEARKQDKYCQYAMISSKEAIEDSKLDLEKINLDKIGVIWGAGIGGLETFQNEILEFAENNKKPRFNPFFIPKMISDMAPGLISIKYGFRGPNFTTVSACASSSNALIDALNYIRMGYVDIIVSGGSEAGITYAGIGGFNALHALSTRNEDPKTASRPFDKERDGFVLGEGSGTIILEEYEHAKKRGAKIYAEFLGAGLSADAHHMTAPHPEGIGAIKVMENCLKDSRINPKDVDTINMHGTSTQLGDIAETKAIKKVFGNHAYNLNINSTKSMTGHLLGAAGAIEAIASIMSIQTKIIPPTINVENLDDRIDPKLNFTLSKAQKKDVKIALSNTFGFGGHNACISFKEIS